MKITAMAGILIASAMGYGQTIPTAAERRVTVCFESMGLGFGVVPSAERLVYQMFAGIGVTIDWRRGFRDCPADALLISLGADTPANLRPGALAYARPYEGSHIQVFYDRICKSGRQPMAAVVLAHVLVHEITHILEGIARHSERGIMKAHWDEKDFFQMRLKPLAFAPEDIDLIYKGLDLRAQRPILTRNAANTMVARR